MEYGYHDYKKVHIWVGNNFDEGYHSYFELDYNLDIDIESLEYKICGFCKDVGKKWYDEDWLGAFQHPKPVSLDILLEEVSVSSDVLDNIKRICKEKGFIQANAMFWYYDGNLVVSDKEKLYNNLVYIGVFDAPTL